MTPKKPKRKKNIAKARKPSRFRRVRKPAKTKFAVKKRVGRKAGAAPVVPKKPEARKRPAKPSAIARKKTAAKKTISARLAKSATSKSRVVRVMRRVNVRISRAVPIAKILSRIPGKRTADGNIMAAKAGEVSKPEMPAELPETYGTGQLHLVARDSRWLYARWDIPRAQLQKFAKRAAAGHLSLRVYQDSPLGKLIKQADLATDSRYWFVPVASGEMRYITELGYETRRGDWVSVAFSNVVTTPPDTIAPDKGVIFATIPLHVTFAQIRKSLDAAYIGRLPLVEAVHQFQAAGSGASNEEIFVAESEWHWTPERALELDKYMGAETIRRRMQGELASLAAAQILPSGSFEWSEEADLSGLADSFTSPGGGWSGDLLCIKE